MDKYEKLKAILDHMKDDTEKFYGGNNASGTRLRKQLQNLKSACNEMREDVQVVRTARREKK